MVALGKNDIHFNIKCIHLIYVVFAVMVTELALGKDLVALVVDWP